MSHHIVEVKDLLFSYPDGPPALGGISFRIAHGESVAVVGANGAGKSTLLLHLNGYLSPTEGSVRIGDFPLTKSTLRDARRTVGMVFQDPDDQLFMPTVYDDVAFIDQWYKLVDHLIHRHTGFNQDDHLAGPPDGSDETDQRR